eukprot:GHVN01079545.1.p1 GENE.GHVN01079545.1~~GHVN01079545.1.p1  ORF type:complete len:101 (+),score=20.64 GHVN01079545.1:139-441(+)
MSDAGAAGAGKKQADFCHNVMERLLNGMGVVGRLMRNSLATSTSCVSRTVYPVKESCIGRYDYYKKKYQGEGARAEAPNTQGVHFTKESSAASSELTESS